MAKYRVFIESVEDPEDSQLVRRLVKLSKRDEKSVAVLLDGLPAILADGVDLEAAQRLRDYLEPAGATVMLKQIGGGAKPASSRPTQTNQETAPRPLNFFKRLGWGFEVFRETWGRQLLLLLTMLGVIIGAELILGVLTGAPLLSGDGAENSLSALASLQAPMAITGMVLAQAIALLAGFWYQASLIRLVASFMEDGGTSGLGEIMRDSLVRTPELVSSVTLVLLPVLLFLGGTSLGLTVLLLPQNPGTLVFSLVLLGLLMLAVFIGFALIGPISVLESRSPWAILRRSWVLSRGRRLHIIGNLLLLAIGLIIVVVGLQLLVGLVLPASLMAGGALGNIGLFGVMGVIVVILMFLALYVLSLFLVSFMMTAFYFEARVHDEAWAPAWEMVPHPSWPASDAVSEPAAGRGVRAWAEMIFYGLVGLVLLVGAMVFFGSQLLHLSLPQAGMGMGETDAGVSTVQADRPLPMVSADLPPGYSLRLQTDAFFATAQNSRLWIKAELAHSGQLPEGVDASGMVSISIDSVSDPTGVDLYDAQSPMESEFHSRPVLTRQAGGELSGVRTVQILAGTREEQIGRIKGEVVLRLPEGLWREILLAGEVGEGRVVSGGLAVKLTRLDGVDAAAELFGADAGDFLAGALGIKDNGEKLVPVMRSTSSYDEQANLNLQFQEPVQGLELILSAQTRVSRHPFDIGPGEVLILGK